MPGTGLKDLPTPPDNRRVDLLVSAFERLDESKLEQRLRCSTLLKSADKARHGKNRRAAKRLARRLRPTGKRGRKRCSSPVYIRDQCIRIGGAIIKLAGEWGTDVRFITVWGKRQRVDIYGLHKLCARTECSSFRRAIERAAQKWSRKSGRRASGWLIAFIDGEHESTRRTVHLHWHGLAAGDMIEVVGLLREHRNFNAPRAVQVEHIRSLPNATAYSMKRYWKSVPRPSNGGAGVPRRLPDIDQSIALLWLDRYELAELCVMYNLRTDAKSGTFRQTFVHE